MSTNAYIGIENPDGSVTAIYSHWDSYLSGVGQTLLTNYRETRKIKRLINHGDVSILGAIIGRKQIFDAPRDTGECLFYSRDRKEKGVECVIYFNVKTFLKKCNLEYTYLWTKDKKWYYRKGKNPLALLIKELVLTDE